MSFRYKLNPKVGSVRSSAVDEKLLNATELSNVTVQNPNSANDDNGNVNGHGVYNHLSMTQVADDEITYPIFALPKPSIKRRGKRTSSIVSVSNRQPTGVTVGPPDGGQESCDESDGGERGGGKEDHFKMNVELDFGRFYGWLERAIWLVMALSISWSLIKDFQMATGEVCTNDKSVVVTPFNLLPSLSRTMSSFRVGTILWTFVVALAFVARLASNTFLHKLYESWYEPTTFNKIFLYISFCADNIEIVSLLMIPAFSLDCDWQAHRFFFILFLVLTYIAELMQYFTRYLRRNKDMVFNEDVEKYYRHIGILILLQTFFIFFMFGGYLLHTYLCTHFLYSIFTFGEYATVVINIRFKRDTVIFVK